MTEPVASQEAARPKQTLRPAAAIIAIHRGDPARGEPLRVLWIRRSENNPFLGGFHSFPGGRLSREDGPIDAGPEIYLETMARCAARETFEETGLLLGWRGTPPPLDEQQRVRRDLLEGKGTFREAVGHWGLVFDPQIYVPCGRWITPHFSRMRFDTNFFLIDCPEAFPPDVWPGELESGEWIDPKVAMRLWEDEKVVLAMPTLYTIGVLAEGGHDLPARLHAIPEANGIPSRYVSVRPGITMVPLRTETIPPATHTNAVVVGDGDVVIIDPGTADPEELFALDEVVQTALLPGRRVLAILLTHRHRDHLAGVDVVRRRYDAPVWGHSLVSDRASLDRELHEGDVIQIEGRHPQKLRVLETPGHSRSHLVFLEEISRTLIAGDLVSGLGTVVIDPPEGNMRDYMSSLGRIQDLNVTVLVPGHGPPHRGVDRLLSALLEHRRMREERVLRALAEGPLNEDALRERVYADTPDAAPELAAKTLRAHLEKLEQEGRVRVTGGRVEVVS